MRINALASGCRRDGEVLRELNARFVRAFLTGILTAEFGLSVSAVATGEGPFEISTISPSP